MPPVTASRLVGLTMVLGLAAAVGACGSSAASTTTPTTGCTPTPTNPECVNPANLLTVTITKGVFSPSPVMVTVGQSVNWLNSDTIAHTATDSGVFDTGSIAPTSAADSPVQFETVGTYNYHCTLHANENGSIVVTAGTLARTQRIPAPTMVLSMVPAWILDASPKATDRHR